MLYRETHVLLDDLAEAVADGTRKEFMESLTIVPLPIIDDFGMRKLPMTAAEDLLEIVMRRYERASTLLTSNRPVKTGENCWAMWRPWQQCSTPSRTTSTCSSAAPAVGAPKTRPTREENAFSNARALPSRSWDLSLFRQNGSLLHPFGLMRV